MLCEAPRGAFAGDVLPISLEEEEAEEASTVPFSGGGGERGPWWLRSAASGSPKRPPRRAMERAAGREALGGSEGADPRRWALGAGGGRRHTLEQREEVGVDQDAEPGVARERDPGLGPRAPGGQQVAEPAQPPLGAPVARGAAAAAVLHRPLALARGPVAGEPLEHAQVLPRPVHRRRLGAPLPLAVVLLQAAAEVARHPAVRGRAALRPGAEHVDRQRARRGGGRLLAAALSRRPGLSSWRRGPPPRRRARPQRSRRKHCPHRPPRGAASGSACAPRGRP
mmetsp:Transcript_33503/g.79490  ORF Transcript_33503/g.79490 Transcript_33503/m.79490 type:complete len:282 (-) Transcript_33503:842-1687(-)